LDAPLSQTDGLGNLPEMAHTHDDKVENSQRRRKRLRI